VVEQKPILYRNQQLVKRAHLDGPGKISKLLGQRIPSWNILGRPKTGEPGTVGFNFETSSLEYWDGSQWLKFPMSKI